MTYFIRLDDACEYLNKTNWERIESLLNKFNLKPLVGIIPHCEDKKLKQYPVFEGFWEKAKEWQNNGWIIALHGFDHVYKTQSGGINPVHNHSEFAGLSLEEQQEKIKEGLEIFRKHDVRAEVFFAPSHTFDENTLLALKNVSDIRFISDTIANKRYLKDNLVIIPQQSGKARKLKFKEVTFCYHPNEMTEDDFEHLEKFLNENRKHFADFSLEQTKHKFSFYDYILKKLYFLRKKK